MWPIQLGVLALFVFFLSYYIQLKGYRLYEKNNQDYQYPLSVIDQTRDQEKP
ncbi:MAG: hypothetical protein OXC40_03195 [Proteobacteria bacterium]|nr:hypothetical protein [Pseudomonadota bacterium]